MEKDCEKKEVNYFIYIKESPLNLKYLGKTQNDPFKYKGSGVHWKRHLKKHNFKSKDIKTIVIFETICKEELKKMGLFFSNFYNVVDDVNFANIVNEEGQGGRTVYGKNHPSKKFRENIRLSSDFYVLNRNSVSI